MKIRKFFLVLAVVLGAFFISLSVKAASVYRLYNVGNGQHFFTASGSEATALANAGWNYDGVAWDSPTSGSTPVYRLCNLSNGQHLFTVNTGEKNYLAANGWRYEGIAFYSGGNIPVYRLCNPNGGDHFFTASLGEKNGDVAGGWRYEGIAFYASSSEYNWDYSKTYSSYSGQVGDVKYPQFEYQTSNLGLSTVYQGNSAYASYNSAVFNFNHTLTQVAASADYADWQARTAWTNKLNGINLTLNTDKATNDTALAQVNQYQTLITKQTAVVTYDNQNKINATKDTALLTQYKASLVTANATYSQTNAAYQKELLLKNNFVAAGTDSVTLTYIVTRSSDNKTVTVTFTQNTKTNGVISRSNIQKAAVLSY